VNANRDRREASPLDESLVEALERLKEITEYLEASVDAVVASQNGGSYADE
jgi:hypothetical protein